MAYMQKRALMTWLAPLSLLPLLALDHAHAQSSGAGAPARGPVAVPGNGALEQVVVTARRRSERIQNVPVSITALSGAQLARRGVTKLDDIRYVAPAFQVQPSPYGPSVPAFEIRGQQQQESLITQDPSVGIYVDEIYQARPHGVNAALFDLDNVQVLEGPQGTLFGRNTSGGAVLIESKRPTSGYSGELDATAGNYGLLATTAVVNVPISDALQVRGAIIAQRHDGYDNNLAQGGRIGDDGDIAWRLSGRLVLGDFQNVLIGSGDNDRSNGFPLILQSLSASYQNNPLYTPASVQGALAQQQRAGFYSVYSDLPSNFSHVATQNITDIATYDLGGLTLKNVIGYRAVRALVAENFDGTNLTVISGLPLQNSYSRLAEHQFSDEFQIQGKALNDRLNFILGAYYFRERGHDEQKSVFGGFGISEDVGGTGTNTSRSVFAQGNYDIVPGKLTLTHGARES